MVWKVVYSGMFNYCDLFLADSAEEAAEKARILAAGASTYYYELVSPYGVRW